MQFDETNSAYKELKFLTPVRRSRRLQEKTSKLPDMLKDHYPCVSSLEQLTELGCETDAFVCRPNAALCGMFSEPDPAEEEWGSNKEWGYIIFQEWLVGCGFVCPLDQELPST